MEFLKKTYAQLFAAGSAPGWRGWPWALATTTCALLLLPWAFLGFNMKDEGAELTRQWQMFSAPREHANIFWLANYLGGGWQVLTQGLGLVGTRLGGVLVTSLAGVAAGLAWWRLLGPRPALLVLAATTMTMSFSGMLGIHYKSLPALLLFASTACLWLGYRQDGAWPARLLWTGLAGALLGLAVHARLPYLLGVVIILPFWLGDLYFRRPSPPRSWLAPGVFLLAFLGALAAGVLVLHWLGAWDHYREIVLQTFSGSNPLYASNHNLESLPQLYLAKGFKSLAQGFKATCFIVFLVVVVMVPATRPASCLLLAAIVPITYYGLDARLLPFLALPLLVVQPKLLAPAGLAALLIGGALIFRFLPPPWNLVVLALGWAGALLAAWRPRTRQWLCLASVATATFGGLAPWPLHHTLPGSCLVMASLACLLSLLARRDPGAHEIFVLSFSGIITGLLVCVGSNQVLTGMYDGLWLILPAGYLFVPIAAAQGLAASPLPATADLRPRNLALAVMIGLALLSWHHRLSDQELTPDLRAPLAEINTAGLRHIVTDPTQAEAVGGLFNALRGLSRPGDSLLAYGHLPMVHYPTRTRPALGDPWPDTFSLEGTRAKLAQLGQAGDFPVCVVRALRPPGPSGDKPWAANTATLDEWVAKAGYRSRWSNRQFEVLTR